MERKKVINEVEELVNTYCRECMVKKQLRLERGKTRAHRFCIKECTVGEQIINYGKYLS
ncbi:zinc-finger domain-containing protein [Jeotgalibacillus proteolyticus]|uniref:Zinc-finger domain-containing protein n=1 Tax=Jeotgalibacillus proteolyticus TaxID=2082395 RepID=A0A2S5GEA4_9BACL|nr:zinc-finger domain-containing protein [Jeotgalibacillus proteolyticus]PPA71213.1 zinc-finger domain-containing protein [Jeotgalibacillus proteolyticus]